MNLWMAAEVQADIADANRRLRNEIESIVNQRLSSAGYGDGVKQWAYISIIRQRQDDAYPEMVQYHKRRRVAEFRLKVDYQSFKDGDDASRRRLICESLLRSLRMCKTLKVADFEFDRLLNDFTVLAQEQGWLDRRRADQDDAEALPPPYRGGFIDLRWKREGALALLAGILLTLMAWYFRDGVLWFLAIPGSVLGPVAALLGLGRIIYGDDVPLDRINLLVSAVGAFGTIVGIAYSYFLGLLSRWPPVVIAAVAALLLGAWLFPLSRRQT